MGNSHVKQVHSLGLVVSVQLRVVSEACTCLMYHLCGASLCHHVLGMALDVGMALDLDTKQTQHHLPTSHSTALVAPDLNVYPSCQARGLCLTVGAAE